MNEEILTMAGLLSCCREEEKPALELLCTAARAQLEAGLREELSAEDCREHFVPAAAWLAAAQLQLRRGSEGEEESFTAGDVSIRRQAALERKALAAAMEQQAFRQMKGLLADPGFVFWSVKV